MAVTTGTAILGAAGIGAVSGLIGGKQAADAAATGQRDAATISARTSAENLAFQKDIWEWQKKQAAPYREIGLSNLGQYQKELNAGFDYTADPGYQFRLDEGNRAIEYGAASRGRSLSSATLRNLVKYNSGMASQEYGASYSRWQDRLNRLGQLGTLGYNATNNLSNMGSSFASTSGGIMMNNASNQAMAAQNMGAINAQSAMLPFNSLMTMGNTAGGLMSGYGMMQMADNPVAGTTQ